MSLNKDFRLACIEAGYNKSCFTGEMHNWDDLQVCHILSKSKTTLNAIKKAYNCSNKTAELIMNMPLLNTVIGSRQDNAEYKKTDDIQYIDNKLIIVVYDVLKRNKIYDSQEIININFNFFNYLQDVKSSGIKTSSKKTIKLLCNYFRNIQLQFHREINLHT